MANLRVMTLVTSTLMAFLSIVAVALRALARRKCKAGFGADDWTIFAALPLVLTLCASCLTGAIAANFGLHNPEPPGSYGVQLLSSKLGWVITWLAVLGPGLTKLSVLLFYKRIFLGVFFRFTSWVMIVLSIAWTVAFFFAMFLYAIPLNCIWQVMDDGCAYVNHDTTILSAAGSDVLLDVMILALPWYPISKLQLPSRRKLSVFGMFALGAIVVAAAIVRLVALRNSLETSSHDSTYVDAPSFYWTAIEAGTGIVGACLPTLGPLFKNRRQNKTHGRTNPTDDGGLPSSFRQKLLHGKQGSPDPIDRELDEVSKAQSKCTFSCGQELEDGLWNTSLPVIPLRAALSMRSNGSSDLEQ